MLNNWIFNSIKRVYINTWVPNLNYDEQYRMLLLNQSVSKDDFLRNESGMELIFKNDVLYRVYKYSSGVRTRQAINEQEKKLRYFSPNYLARSKVEVKPNGKHRLGGAPNSNFSIPKGNFESQFQYLGFVSHEDDMFSWMPFDFHICCPLFLSFPKLYMDYSNPYQPKIMNIEEIENSYDDYDLGSDKVVTYEDTPFGFEPGCDDESIGHTGTPMWIQHPFYPKCPKTNRRMRYLCQFRGGIKVKESNIDLHSLKYSDEFSHMNFWGSGDLYIFFEPKSRVACYFIQST